MRISYEVNECSAFAVKIKIYREVINTSHVVKLCLTVNTVANKQSNLVSITPSLN